METMKRKYKKGKIGYLIEVVAKSFPNGNGCPFGPVYESGLLKDKDGSLLWFKNKEDANKFLEHYLQDYKASKPFEAVNIKRMNRIVNGKTRD